LFQTTQGIVVPVKTQMLKKPKHSYELVYPDDFGTTTTTRETAEAMYKCVAWMQSQTSS
jgi:hypothetical protein